MKGWEVKTLGEICDFENGDRGKNYPSKSTFVQSGVPFINAGHLGLSGIDMKEMNFIPRQRFNLLTNGKIRTNDVLFCLRGSLGKFAPVNDVFEGAIASSLVIIRPGQQVLRDFILAYLGSSLCAGMIEKYRNGAAQPNLSAKNLADFEIPLPPLDEQRRIVAILDEAFAGLAVMRQHGEANLKNARALFDSHLNAIFSQRGEGWEVKALDTISDRITDGTHLSPDYVDQGVPMLDSKHIKGGFYIDNTTPEKFISLEADNVLSKRCKPQPGDILISSRGSIGKIAIVRPNQDFNIMGNMILVRPNSSIDRLFLAYQIKHQVGRLIEIAKGVAQKGLYLNQIRLFELSIPPLDVQTKIGGALQIFEAETTRLESLYRQKLAAIDELKQSILHRAFSGALSAKDALAA